MSKQKGFFIIENKVFDYRLKPYVLSVYTYLCKCKNSKNNTCFPSRENIALNCNMSIRSVDKAIKELVSLLLIKKISRFEKSKKGKKDSQRSNLYSVESISVSGCEIHSPCDNPAPDESNTISPPGVESAPITRLSFNNTFLNNPSFNNILSLNEIFENCQIDLIKDKDLKLLIGNTLREMYHSESIMVSNIIITKDDIRKTLSRLDSETLEYIFSKLRQHTSSFRCGSKYLMACIYNGINDYSLKLDVDIARDIGFSSLFCRLNGGKG